MSATSGPRPVSERKLAANRANAKRSTGPRTPEGKARTGRNGLTHGLRASPVVLLAAASDQERELFSRLLADLHEQYHPHGVTERLLVERIGLAYLRMLRACQAERGAMASTYRYADPEGISGLPLHLPDLLQADAAAERSLHRERLDRRREATVEATHGPANPPRPRAPRPVGPSPAPRSPLVC